MPVQAAYIDGFAAHASLTGRIPAEVAELVARLVGDLGDSIHLDAVRLLGGGALYAASQLPPRLAGTGCTWGRNWSGRDPSRSA